MKIKIIGLVLIILSTISCSTEQNKIEINVGTGNFTIKGGFNHEKDSIKVHYYKPKNHKPNSPVIIVLPGAGRNGDGYRDKWINAAKKHNLLVLSPSYSRKYYPKTNHYNLGRLPKSSLINGSSQKSTTKVEWIFDDFDRIFDIAVKTVGSTEKKYDIFGHSAGAQTAHRLIMFNPETKVNRIVAANSGWYTLPDFSTEFPYGLKGVALTKEDLKKSFKMNLIILTGELDNKDETRGDLRSNEQVNTQGLGRVSRADFFYKTAVREAKELNCKFLWKHKIIKGVGHSSTKMSVAAAKYLYSTNN
jgi:predicted esterase